MTIAPGQYCFTIYQGAVFNPVIALTDSGGTPINLTGYTAAMQARTTPEASTAFINLTTENGGITLGGSAGTITLLLTATQTALIVDNGVYDLKLIDNSGVPNRYLEGSIIVSLDVTR